MVWAGSRLRQQAWATCDVMPSAQSGTSPSITPTTSAIQSVVFVGGGRGGEGEVYTAYLYKPSGSD